MIFTTFLVATMGGGNHSNKILNAINGDGDFAVAGTPSTCQPSQFTGNNKTMPHLQISQSVEGQSNGLVQSQTSSDNVPAVELNNDQQITKDEKKVQELTPCTPTMETFLSRGKQGSPFYAEPADKIAADDKSPVIVNILRRSQRSGVGGGGNSQVLPVNHRHSEPPKGGFIRTPVCPMLMPAEIERIAGSLDELKKKQQQMSTAAQQPSKRTRAKPEQWQLDSSWEFMGNEHPMIEMEKCGGDYDAMDQWKESTYNHRNNGENTSIRDSGGSGSGGGSSQNSSNPMIKRRPITVHQIIAKRLPDLNLPELIRCSTPPQISVSSHEKSGSNSNVANSSTQRLIEGSSHNCRLSSYDNVERSFLSNSYPANRTDSTHSDDGTVFSEPWDSSQWDSFVPHDGKHTDNIRQKTVD